MNIIKISDLPLQEDVTTRIRIIELEDGLITFMFRGKAEEFICMIEKPKNKYWKNVKLSKGQKINIKIERTGKNKSKQLVRVG